MENNNEKCINSIMFDQILYSQKIQRCSFKKIVHTKRMEIMTSTITQPFFAVLCDFVTVAVDYIDVSTCIITVNPCI